MTPGTWLPSPPPPRTPSCCRHSIPHRMRSPGSGPRMRPSKDEWRWVVGPEAGTQFSQGATPTPPFNFANWGPVEPNNDANEDFAVFNLGPTSPAGTGPGEWGDTKASAGNVSSYLIDVPRRPGAFDRTTAVPGPCVSLGSLAASRAREGDLSSPHRTAVRRSRPAAPSNKGSQLTTDSWAFLSSVAFWRRCSAAWR